jgi:hypothetical protein
MYRYGFKEERKRETAEFDFAANGRRGERRSYNFDKQLSMIRKSILFLFAALICSGASGQSFEQAKSELSSLMTKAREEYDYDAKQEYIASFAELLHRTLKTPGSLDFSFDSIPFLKVISTADGNLRIFNWGAPKSDSEFSYGAIIQRRTDRSDSLSSDIFVLSDKKKQIDSPETKILNCPDWYGCLYSEIIEVRDAKTNSYTLLGFDLNNGVSHKKYIDVLTFDRQGLPSFGAPVFVDPAGIKSRVIFEYSAKSVLNLRYIPDLKTIAFNWLYPIVPEKGNDRSYYVPDITYDGYELKSGMWSKVKNVLLKKDRF